ncbi:unnamed protein product [Meganyctiphanes norvegica]|uniref:Peroxinectin n=1 Tax=Meganyctiphanes norvegica TaxID=48144 RepID=A0AAV2R5L8_MEGNR
MAFLKHWVLLIAAIYTVIVATQSSPIVAEDQEPLLTRVVRQVAFQGQSQRPPFPGTNNGQCDCQYHVVCASQLDKIQQSCQLPGGGTGVCCPPVGGIGLRIGATGGRSSVLRQQRPPQGTSRNQNTNMINSACRKGINEVEKLSEIEKLLLRKGIILKRGTPASNHLRVFKTGPQTPEIHKNALTMAMASSQMRSDFQLSNCASTAQLQGFDVHNSILGNMCPVKPRCQNPNSKYRTADGSCNNIRNPDWGMSQTALRRLLPPKYEDCIRTPRVTSVTGSPLPLARTLSNNLLIDNNQPDQSFTLSVMQWAQFMDHDLSHTPFPEFAEGAGDEGIRCCTPDNKFLPPGDQHPLCMPIEIPRNDGFFSPRGHTCMNFVRSDLAPDYACRFGFQENINILTQWVDGSTVYGQNQKEQNILRANRSGLLRFSGNNFLPQNPEAAECDAPNRGGVCYLAGESRVNEQPGLTMFHTIWMRQHNRIARQLQQLNPRWSDNAVFQETRRIIAAQIAHITYNEWLPIIVGERFMSQFGLSPQRSGFSSDYDPSINANINNEFSTAAFRFGHSMVQGIINLFSAQGSTSSTRLRDNFMSAHLITQPGFFDGFIRGLTRQASQKFDNFVTQDLSNHCYQTPQHDFGMDLMSLNIQRGRDHAIGTYNEARVLCGLRRATSFNHLLDTMLPQTVQRIQQQYASVDDIDMFVGGMSETPVLGGILGPTFLCIVGDQFARLQKADRYFYELGGQAGSFEIEQLQEIRRTSWARILCDNSENLDSIQPLAFRFPSRFNPLVPCRSPIIPQLNLQPWLGERPQA